MTFNKNKIRGYIALAIIDVVFTTIAFTAPFDMETPNFWLAYMFGTLAIVAQFLVFNMAFIDGGDAKSKFYGFPIARIGFVYIAVQLAVSFIEMALGKHLPLWVLVIVNVLIFAIAALGLIAADAVREEVERQDVKIKTDVNNMRELQSMSASLVKQCEDEETKKVIQNIADEFRFSDPVSNDQTKEIEGELKTQLSEIQKAVIDGANEDVVKLCKQISVTLAERNRICKLEK